MTSRGGNAESSHEDVAGSIAGDATIGYDYDGASGPTRVGRDSVIRPGSVVYKDVSLGARCQVGHNATIREETRVGDDVVIGTNVVIDGHVDIGSRVSLQTGVYVPPGTAIGDDVFIGPYAVLTNDRYPLRRESELVGPTVGDNVSIGANATILPAITLGDGSFVAAGAIATEDVPPETLAVGTPARHRPLPAELQGGNEVR